MGGEDVHLPHLDNDDGNLTRPTLTFGWANEAADKLVVTANNIVLTQSTFTGAEALLSSFKAFSAILIRSGNREIAVVRAVGCQKDETFVA